MSRKQKTKDEHKQIRNSKYIADFKEYRGLALKEALKVRQFEIELYWKRATYFWTLIGATFASFALIYSATTDGLGKDLLLGLVSCLGFIFSLAWHYVNKGSKYWQENWENHVSMLENKVHGKLYKTVLERPRPNRFFSKDGIKHFFVAPQSYSVSKINQLVSIYVVWIWVFLAFGTAFKKQLQNCSCLEWFVFLPLGFGVLAFLGFVTLARSSKSTQTPKAFRSKIRIKKPS